MAKPPKHPPPGPEGIALKRERMKAGLSQRALAEKSGLTHGMIGEIESGKRQEPELGTLRTLAAALRVPLWALVDMGDDVEIDAAIAAYLADPLSKANPPTADEIEELRKNGLHGVALGGAPPALSVHLVLEALRVKARSAPPAAVKNDQHGPKTPGKSRR